MPGPPTFIEVYIYSIFSFGWVEANTLSNAATMYASSVHNKQRSLGNDVNININKNETKITLFLYAAVLFSNGSFGKSRN